MLNFASQELNSWEESSSFYDFPAVSNEKKTETRIGSIKLFADKIRTPDLSASVKRPRLIEHLRKSTAQYSATLITGRAGMGKTNLAANFAEQSGCRYAWYKAETADTDWEIFSSYLLGSLQKCCPDFDPEAFNISETEIAAMSEILAAQFSCAAGEESFLIVLDDLHSVFDAVWFTEFFNNFVPTLTPNVHLLMIARTLPPLQLWRLRSKQVLGVMDEKLLTFNLEETKEFFRNYKLSPTVACSAHKRTYGRIGKLEEIAAKKSFT